MTLPSDLHRLLAAWIVILCAGVAGCSETPPPPDLHPVSGVVVGLNGEAVTSGGTIEFCSPTDPDFRAVAGFDKSGRFELSSRDGNEKHLGARPGSYQVTVFPSGAKYIEPIELPKAVIIAPQDNELTIKIDASKL